MTDQDAIDARILSYYGDLFDEEVRLSTRSSSCGRRRSSSSGCRRVAFWISVAAQAFSRFIAFGQMTLARPVPNPFPAEWVALAATGEPAPGMRFPAGHFHTAEELEAEIRSSGLNVEAVLGVEGPAGGLLETLQDAGEELIQSALTVARAAASIPGIRDMSAHLMAVARVPS